MALILVIALLLSLTTQAYEFNSFAAWETPQSIMQKTESTLVLKDPGYAYASIGENNWSDYQLKLKLKPLSYGKNSVLRLFFRQDFLWNSYSLDITSEKSQIVRYDGTWEKYKVLTNGRGIKAGEEVEITLEAKEDLFKVYFNEELVMETDSTKFKTGKIVLFSENVAFEAKDPRLQGTFDEEYSTRDLGYFPKGDPQGGGVEHMVLIYGNVGTKWGLTEAYPYVGYLTSLEESNYEIDFKDYMFDSALFLALTAPDGHAFDSPNRGKPAVKEHWQWYMDSLFAEGQQLAAFNEAIGLVNEQLGQEKKLKIYIMIPNPMAETSNFGDVDGTGSLNFTLKDAEANKEQRFKAVKWYVDSVLDRYRTAQYENLELIGFYWVEEIINRRIPGEIELLKTISDYLHTKELKYSWIPYFGVDGRREYEKLGFDLCIYQPNYMFGADIPPSRLLETAKEAYKYRLGVEIEADYTVLSTLKGREKFRDYLRAGLSYGFMNEATVAYYQDVKVFGSAALSSSPEQRQVYDDLYKFIKGTWEEPLESRK